MKKILCLLLCAAFIACTDDNNIPVPKPVVTEETLLNRVNEIYDIKIPGDADWTVTKNPKWASPMNRTGEAGTSLSLFVETNDNDADRRDSLVISLSNGGKVSLPLRQHGRASSDENDDAINMAATDLLQKTRGVGCGIDVIAPMTGVTSEKYNIKSTPFNLGALNEVIKAMGWEDAIVDEPVYSSRYETVTGNSTGAIGNQLGVNAGIEVGVKAFKFSVEAGYTSSSQSNTQSYYAIQEIQHIVASRYVRAGLMRYLARHEKDFKHYITVAEKEEPTIFAETFFDDLTILQSKLDESYKEEAMQDLLDTYGTHIVCHGTLGGEMKVSMQMTVDAENSASNIHAALSLSAKVVNVRGEFEMSDAEKMASTKTTLSLRSFGGNNPWTIAPGETFTGFKEKVQDKSKLDKWVQAIKDSTALALIDVQTIPIWDLMPTDELRDKLRNYVVVNYQKKWYGNNFKPDIYEVKGFDVTNNAPGYGSIYLPEIELQIDMERTIVPDLSTDELSTVIYSGPKDSVDHTRGFFVGSLTRKPCKFRREKKGTFTTEVFDRLKEEAIGILYVDVSGDITIASKVSSGVEKDLYQTCDVTNWKHDLKMLTSDWTFKDNITVEGTTDHCIHIADGTTLTLDNVTVNNQIVCDGNATIVLKDGTRNSVSQGIVNGPEGTTLTICGSGSLTATGKDSYPGIGNGKGNIVISGGTITAIGGRESAAIGTGLEGGCGDITIKSSVNKVEATAGLEYVECVPIGYGDYGTCGSLTIEDPSKVTQIDNNTPELDLQYLKADCIIKKNNRVLHGITSHQVKFADGLTVTLSGIVMTNKLECEGSAHIILASGTDNAISIDYPYCNGILNGPNGTTLTISGDGHLKVQMVSYQTRDCAAIGGGKGDIVIAGGNIIADARTCILAPGIGANLAGKCGNIKITGGDITAMGGRCGAGIGSGGMHGDTPSECGNIDISGGTVTAYGGSLAAGIGCGHYGNCGDIIIRKTVQKVTAKKGDSWLPSIGNTTYGNCGTVTIEEGANVIQE